ncbi:50S ribosomal protein L3 [Candidatus Pacearchaeota archaeon]|nr:50S ribosomal protein L3 [Candidatus Pacearchaeota archaeon]
MPTLKSPRKGSLQIWPRKRARKFLPRVNWDAIDSKKNLKGFICYKVGMASVFVKDNTATSMTKGKKIVIPATIVECPPMKILSIRLYKHGDVAREILNENLDKELKRILKLPKSKKMDLQTLDKKDDFDDLRVVAYSLTKKTGIKKTPDLAEIGLSGNLDEKINFVKENLNKELSVLNNFTKGELVDFRGLTKGRGFSGPVKRFGISLKSHKSEKGQRRPGSLGPWHPSRVTFKAPQAGNIGMFTRISYNSKIIDIGKADNKKEFSNIKNFGDLQTDYIIVNGSVQGPAKRQILVTAPLRETKKQSKNNFDLLEVLR